MHKPIAAPVFAGLALLALLLLMGCGTISPTASPTPTFTPTAAPPIMESPTPCLGGYNWAYGSVPPEFIPRVQEAMTASGLQGTVQAGTFGENDGCGRYLARDVDYQFSLDVPELEANQDLANDAEKVLQIARHFVGESSAPNLGHLQLTFRSGDAQCHWAYESGAWTSTAGSGTGCQAPTSPESQRFADALAMLATDLDCESSTRKADTLHAGLECERHEGSDLYVVSVEFSTGELDYAETCFHGWRASEYNLTGDDPMTVSEGSKTYYERDRSFQWFVNGRLFYLLERIKGGPDVRLPPDTRETIYQRALQAGLIPGEGSDCN